jgi:CheY-like chemotaxis protein
VKLLGSGDVDHLDPASAYYTVSYTLERAFTRELVSYPASSDINVATTVAPDGVEAIWYGREHDYDAIVLDVMIPPPDVSRLSGSCAGATAGRPSCCLRLETRSPIASTCWTPALTTI